MKCTHLVEDGFDVDRQVSVRAAEPSDDTKAQAWGASLQSNSLIHTSPVKKKKKVKNLEKKKKKNPNFLSTL